MADTANYFLDTREAKPGQTPVKLFLPKTGELSVGGVILFTSRKGSASVPTGAKFPGPWSRIQPTS
jgi:hypothetical protein